MDESFVDFSFDYKNNSLLHNNILEKNPNLIVIKSFSKSYGVPGIRLGILCSADKDLIVSMKKNVCIWNLNSLAEFFMQIYSKYEKDYLHACDRIIAERSDFEGKLKSIKFLRVMPSQANFFLCEVLPPKNAKQIVIEALKEFNILIKDCSDKKGFDGKQYLRVSIRNHEDNAKFIEALKIMEKR